MNQILMEEKKEDLLKKRQVVEARMVERSKKKEEQLKVQQKVKEQKQMQAEQVRKNMLSIEQNKKAMISEKISQKQKQLELTQKQRDELIRIKMINEELKRQDKVEAVKRLQKIKDYQRQKLREQLELQSMKVDEKNKQKEELQIKKQQMRKKAEIEKKRIMEEFAKLKNKKGSSLNRSGFQKLASELGIIIENRDDDNSKVEMRASNSRQNLSSRQNRSQSVDPNYDPKSMKHKMTAQTPQRNQSKPYNGMKKSGSHASMSQKKSKARLQQEALKHVQDLKMRQNKQLLDILNQEQKREQEREEQLRLIEDPQERKRLQNIFGIERHRSSNRIVQISERNQRQLHSEMRKYGIKMKI